MNNLIITLTAKRVISIAQIDYSNLDLVALAKEEIGRELAHALHARLLDKQARTVRFLGWQQTEMDDLLYLSGAYAVDLIKGD